MKQCSSLIYCLFRRGATAPKQRCHIDDWPGNKVLTTDFTGTKRHQTVAATCHWKAIWEAGGSHYYINLFPIRRDESNYPFHGMPQNNWMRTERGQLL